MSEFFVDYFWIPGIVNSKIIQKISRFVDHYINPGFRDSWICAGFLDDWIAGFSKLPKFLDSLILTKY